MAEAMHQGGAERQLSLLIQHLDRERFQPFLFTWIQPEKEAYLDQSTVEWIKCIRRNKFDFRPILVARKLIKERNIQLVHGILDTGNLYAGLLKLLSPKVTFIASERSSHRQLSKFQKIHKPLMHRLAATTIANSQKGAAFVHSLGIRRKSGTVVVPNGIDGDYFQAASRQQKRELKSKLLDCKADTRIILCVGSMYPVKDQLGILEAFYAAKPKNSKLVFVGKQDATYVQGIKEFLAKNNLLQAVQLYPAQEAIQLWYQAADCLILNSIFEGTPNAVLEAMASGLPILATAVGDVPKYVVEGVGWLYEPKAHRRLVELLQLIDNLPPEDLEQKGLAARKQFLQLGLDKDSMVKRHEQIYTEQVSTVS